MRSRRSALRGVLAGIALACVLVAAQAWQHHHRRADIYRAAARSPAVAAELIARRFGQAKVVCHPAGSHDDRDNLVSALFALEHFALSPLEAEFERLAVAASSALSRAPPDLTYGIGQIRLHRAVALAHAAKWDAPSEGGIASQVADKLLDACAARLVARRLLAADAEIDDGQRLGRARIARAAARYNAQARPDSVQAALAHQVFNEIAYHLTLHYRYTAAPQRATAVAE